MNEHTQNSNSASVDTEQQLPLGNAVAHPIDQNTRNGQMMPAKIYCKGGVVHKIVAGVESDRNGTIAAIRTALKARSGKTWSVTGGRGTAWGWIRIDAPPARRIKHYRLKFDMPDHPENYESYLDPSRPDGYMTDSDQAELAHLLGLARVHDQGESVPASSEYRREYIDRAEGRTPSVLGTQYWD